MRSLTPNPENEALPPKCSLHLDIQDKIAWLTFDLPGEKVNKLTAAVMMSLSDKIKEIEERNNIEGLIIGSAKEGIFIAGADINEIKGVTSRAEAFRASRMGHEIFGQIESMSFPVVAAINGVCLGGGTELALSCHGRVGTDHPKFQIGLPEVNLGIIPAWGGTTRAPRLVGLQRGLELILTGRGMDAKKAKRIGLIDRAVPHQQVRERALELVHELRQKKSFGKPRRRRAPGITGWLLEANPLGRAMVFRQSKKMVLSRTHGQYPAPLDALKVVRRGLRLSVEKNLELEAETAADLIVSDISKSLIHLFFLNENAKKDQGVSAAIEKPAEINTTGLLGAGTMGGGIAWLFSYRDIPVRVKDLDAQALGAGMKEAYRLLDKRRKRRRMTPWQRDRKMTLISPTLDWSGFKKADVLVEAVVEDIGIKKKVLREVETVVLPDCLIASNTSTLPITELQSALTRPERMAGFHFFNPVERMPLIEVIRGRKTNDETVAALVAFAKRIGKTPVVVNDCPGFLVNRILGPYLNEAGYLLLETGDLEGIDKALLGFGMPMGPLRLLDEVGIDVAAKAGKVLSAAYDSKPSGVIEKLAAAGRLGKKTGRGLYTHAGKRSKADTDAVLELLGTERRRSVGRDEAVERLVHPMVAEAARCLEENVVRSPGELDLAMVMGTGFAPFRGGLLRYADSVGLQSIVDSLEGWREKLGGRFELSSLMVERARLGQGFYD